MPAMRREASVAPAPGSGATDRFAVGLAADSEFAEVVALDLIVPPMLAWFCPANTMDRYRRILVG